MSSVKLQGGKELERKLLALDRKIARKIVSQALRAGAKVILKQARANAPKRTGLLRRSLKVKAGKSKKGRVSFVVQTAAGHYKGETFYGSFVEFGHKLGKRRRAKGVKDERKRIPAQPFLEPAFNSKKEQAARVIADVIRQGIYDSL